MDANVKPSQLITKEAGIADNDLPTEIDDGDAELPKMIASIDTMDDDFLHM